MIIYIASFDAYPDLPSHILLAAKTRAECCVGEPVWYRAIDQDNENAALIDRAVWLGDLYTSAFIDRADFDIEDPAHLIQV